MQNSLRAILWLFTTIIPAYSCASGVQIKDLYNGPDRMVFEIQLPQPSLRQNSASAATDVFLQGASLLLEKGAPELPYFSVPVEIDEEGAWQVSLLDSTFTDLGGQMVTPSRGNLKRNQDISNLPYQRGSVYQMPAFYPASAISVSDPYIIRSERGISVKIMAARFNAPAGVLRTYQRMVIELKKVAPLGLNPLPSFARQLPKSEEWSQILRSHFCNDFNKFKYNPTSEAGNMLIICHTDNNFIQALQPFVRWKTERGLKVDLITYAQAGGTASSMKAYIQNNMPSQAWSFVLIVGDAPQITPAYITSGPSDQWFGDIIGNDRYPDIMVGRFSANNVSELSTQVRRSIWYEKEMIGSAGYLGNALGIGSDEGPGDDAEMDWEHQRGILNQLTGFTYNSGFELYDGSHGNNDAPGNPQPSDLAALVNDGIGIINYTGHGGSTSFVTTGFSNPDVNALNNVGKLPFIYSVACVNGEFQTGTCFAESWLRAESGGNPTGAVAVLMSTINQSWNPPMEGQDEMNAILSESIAGNIKRTFSGIALNGCLKMNDSYGAAGADMTDTWTVFGDPSLLIRTEAPLSMQVNHPLSVSLGASSVSVNVNVDSAMVALSQNGVLLDADVVSGGLVNLNFAPVASTDSLLVTVTGFNRITYQGNIAVTAPTSSFVVMTGQQIQDPLGNNNQLADFDEFVEAILQISNLGLSDAQNVTVQVQSSDTLVSGITPSNFTIAQLGAGSLTNLSPLQFQIASWVPDGHQVVFDVEVSDGTQTQIQQFSVTLHAPVLSTMGFTINDQSGGNGNGRLEAGETAAVTIMAINSGSSASPQAAVSLNSLSPNVTVLNSVQYPGTLPTDTTAMVFNLAVTPADSSLYQADFSVQLLAGAYQHISPRSSDVNQIMEDFETNNPFQWDWTQQGAAPWFTTTLQPYAGSNCSQSGDVDDSQSTSLIISLDVAAQDSISFARRISSEQDWDFLQFFIDNNQMASWSGNMGWQRVSFPVTAGNHVFMWTYSKDSYLSDGSDCAWIDEILWPPFLAPQDTTSTSGLLRPGSESAAFTVYPNPASDFVSVSFDLDHPETVSANLLDATGRLVRVIFSASVLGSGRQNLLFPLSETASGLFFVQIVRASGEEVNRLIIKK